MNPYAIVGSGIGTPEAASLHARLMAWHDAMVAHERRLRSRQTTDACEDHCPHVEACGLWVEVSAILGPRASELTFLRSRALSASPSHHLVESAKPVSGEADSDHRSSETHGPSVPRQSESLIDSPAPSRMATADL